jgi:hypothetical protein
MLLQNECCYKIVRGTKQYLVRTVHYKTVRLQDGNRYKTVCVTKRYVLQNGTLQNSNRYYGLGGRLL